MITPIPLLPGDHLLYGSKDFFGLVTSIKTWSPAVHIEIFTGWDDEGDVVASRNGIGVNFYPYRPEQLIAVLRPHNRPNLARAMQWFYDHARGQKYDWLGLLCFTLAVKQGSKNKMFCSEFAKRWDKMAGIESFHREYPSDKIAPGDFPQSAAFHWVWLKEGVRF